MGSSPPVIPLQQQERMTEPLSEELMGGQDHRQQLAQAVDRLNFSRNGLSSGGRHTSGGGGRGSGRGGKAAWAGAARAGDVSELGYKVFSALQAFASAGVGVPRRSGVELAVPGVVTDSDYRLRLSTGIKFCDTHMVTVLDESRVLLDEVMVGGHDEAAGGSADGGSWCRRGGGMVHLNAEYI